MLTKFDDICRTNGIDYCLHAGTLLGSVRDDDFIPWDDDADLSMRRESFDRLSSMRNELEDEDIQFIFPEDSDTFYDFIPGFHCDRYLVELKISDPKEQGHPRFTPPKIDLFVMDDCKEGLRHKMIIFRLLSKYLLARGHRQIRYKLDLRVNIILRPILSIIAKTYEIVGSHMDYSKILKKYDRISRMENDSGFAQLYISNDQPWSLSKIYSKSMYEETTNGKLGNKEFSIPVGYDGVLKEIYGDYHIKVPEDQRKPMHYNVRRKA